MVAVKSLLTGNEYNTKDERAEAAIHFNGTDSANHPFYWKERDDGKKLVCAVYAFFWTVSSTCMNTGNASCFNQMSSCTRCLRTTSISS
jgi:hypothetical protein